MDRYHVAVTTVQLESGSTERPDAHGDPRALSQAWYDALYGSRASRGDATVSAKPAIPARSSPVATHGGSIERNVDGSALHQPVAIVMTLTELRQPCVAREALEPLGRRALVRRATPDRFAADTDSNDESEVVAALATDGVALAVRRENDGVRVVATCRPDAMATVEHALERARSALAARGIRLSSELSIRGNR